MLWWLISVYSIISYIFIFYLHLTFKPPYIYIYLAVFLLDILPTLLVHCQYLIRNWGATLIINKDLETVKYISSSENLTYKFEDIDHLEHIASYGGGGWYSFGQYRYFKIVFKDGKSVIVTCLMVKDIKLIFETLLGIKAVKKLKAVAFI